MDEQFVKYIDDMIYHVCDGKPTEMDAFKNQRTYIDFLNILNNHLIKVQAAIDAADKSPKEKTNNSNSKKGKHGRNSRRNI